MQQTEARQKEYKCRLALTDSDHHDYWTEQHAGVEYMNPCFGRGHDGPLCGERHRGREAGGGPSRNPASHRHPHFGPRRGVARGHAVGAHPRGAEAGRVCAVQRNLPPGRAARGRLLRRDVFFNICSLAAKKNRLDLLRFAHSHGCAWGNTARIYTARSHVDCLHYAFFNGCPLQSTLLEFAAEKAFWAA